MGDARYHGGDGVGMTGRSGLEVGTVRDGDGGGGGMLSSLPDAGMRDEPAGACPVGEYMTSIQCHIVAISMAWSCGPGGQLVVNQPRLPD